jgi:hypothetical protein
VGHPWDESWIDGQTAGCLPLTATMNSAPGIGAGSLPNTEAQAVCL